MSAMMQQPFMQFPPMMHTQPMDFRHLQTPGMTSPANMMFPPIDFQQFS